MRKRQAIFGALVTGVLFVSLLASAAGEAKAAGIGNTKACQHAQALRSRLGETSKIALMQASLCLQSAATAGKTDNYLYDDSGSSVRDIWAVGEAWPTDSSSHPLVLHSNGLIWNIVSVPGVGQYSYLGQVSALSPVDVWAVGTSYPDDSGNSSPLIEHWDGATWSIVSTPTPPSSECQLNGISVDAPNDAWSVGYCYFGNVIRTLVEHWDGTAWQIVSAQNPSAAPIARDRLRDVVALAPDNVWAVGVTVTRSQDIVTLIEHWNGTQWTVVSSPNMPAQGTQGVNSELQRVAAASATDIWAVGDYVTGSGDYHMLTLHWDGSTWSIVSSPVSAAHNDIPLGLTRIIGTSNFAVVGRATVDGSNPLAAYAFAMQWDGTSWNFVDVPSSGISSLLAGVAGISQHTIWAVGSYASTDGSRKTLIDRSIGANWFNVPSPNQ